VRLKELLAMGLPQAAAHQVATGQRQLNDVIQELARKDKAQRLMADHGIPHSLAMQCVLGQANLQDYLERQRRHAYAREHGPRSCFDEAQVARKPLVMALLGRELRTLVVLEVDKYELCVQEEGKEPERLHKLRVKLCHTAEDRKAARRAIGQDKALKDVVAEPLWRIQDRYPCADKVLFPWQQRGTRVTLTLVEGERIQGAIEWYSRYEIGLRLKDARVIVMRHALLRAEAE
jgi:sRNA-binding regulator protein Hfq